MSSLIFSMRLKQKNYEKERGIKQRLNISATGKSLRFYDSTIRLLGSERDKT